MKKISIVAALLVFSLSAHAEWYLRGTHNNWQADPMQDIGSNTVIAGAVVFAADGEIKFDRYGDWSENYGLNGARDGANIPVSAGTWDIEFYTDTHDYKITAAGTTYHLRGTHNSWAEGDLMAPVAGTSQYEACRNFTSGDANGGPRFKVDPDGGWGTDAFPAADQAASGWTHIVVDGGTNTLVSVTTDLGTDCGTPQVSQDFRNRTIYFAFVDRFNNGDTSNDNGNNAAATSTTKQSGDISEWKKYWGGDIQGLIDKLDYLQALGVTAIWVTPLVNNIDNSGSEGAYHGYWGRDFYEVDEHLGDWALVDQLDAAMEARGMKLVLDIALNHSNQDDQYEFGALYKEGVFVTDNASDNGTWYHHNGAIADCYDSDPSTSCPAEWDDPWAYRNKTLFNLTDFNHGTSGSNSAADQYLIDAASKWMSHGVDAFRIDAIKHIEPGFIDRFSAAMRAQNPDVYIFGEWYGAGAGDSNSMTFLNENHGSELLDFQLRNQIEAAIAGDITMTALDSHIQSRPGAMGGRESWQPIFLDNHDATRTSVYLQTTGPVDNGRTGKGFSKALADARQNLGMALVMTLPGIPTIYYGTEQNSTWFTANGDGQVGHDPYNREAMPSFAQTSAAFQEISALAELRAQSPALASGSYNQRWVNGDILVFERQSGSDVVLVAVNRGGSTSITVSSLALADGSYASLVGSDVVSVSGGSAVLNLDANEVIVLH
ncbi:alpha-amylase family glycosyl hydrolase [Microbulbifer hainanensis]|uniref:alpha-amylase family glycosyl hydrolase n=1 Tax=Microbulbifer hainanensis TaxID=2735675 RepID=UPI0018691785|nr:alpha-amylase family glycosyl hydrolase [Microbulbifer hainanensis]